MLNFLKFIQRTKNEFENIEKIDKNKKTILSPKSVSQIFVNLSWIAQIEDLKLLPPFALSPHITRNLIPLLYSSNLPWIILIGKSGAGKGTLAEKLKKRFNYHVIPIGDINRAETSLTIKTSLAQKLEQIVKKKTFYSKEMAELTHGIIYRKLGLFIEDPENLFKKFKPISNHPIIFDNFPFSLPQLNSILDIIKKKSTQKFVLIEPLISDDESKRRLLNRIICASCHAIYNMITAPPKNPEICDSCSSKLSKRKDDTKKTILTKFDWYKEHVVHIVKRLMKEIPVYQMNQNQVRTFEKYLGL